jgi:ubiquinone/menaquinone biosynthesis C-methylase UbiE
MLAQEENPSYALCEMLRIAKPGGIIVTNGDNKTDMIYVRKKIREKLLVEL